MPLIIFPYLTLFGGGGSAAVDALASRISAIEEILTEQGLLVNEQDRQALQLLDEIFEEEFVDEEPLQDPEFTSMLDDVFAGTDSDVPDDPEFDAFLDSLF